MEKEYDKSWIITTLDSNLNKTLGIIDNKGIFDDLKAKGIKKEKGIAGRILEQCVFGYPADTKAKPDIIVVEDNLKTPTELKVTGIILKKTKNKTAHYIAKEPMSITAVSIYTLAEQKFETSTFWAKLEHTLLVYYHYKSEKAVAVDEYRNFPIVGYEFHEFDDADKQTLKNDWELVHRLVINIESKVTISQIDNENAWKAEIEKLYIKEHNSLKGNLAMINLAPKFPPRFRLTKPVVTNIIEEHFGDKLEQLPNTYTSMSALHNKCAELQEMYFGKTLGELADLFNVSRTTITKRGEVENKSIAEQVLVKMFGGASKKINQIELFQKFGVIAKTIAVTSKGSRTEDMKMYLIDFEEMINCNNFDESELYNYFSDHKFLCILYKEPELDNYKSQHRLVENKFLGFKWLTISDDFVETKVKNLWEDTRYKIASKTLKLVPTIRKDESIVINKSGSISEAPNFLKSKDNDVFIRGSADDSSAKSKTLEINGLRMIPQAVWLKGSVIVKELSK